MALYCVSCGNANPEGSFACQRCGQALPPAVSGGAGGFGASPWGSDPNAPSPGFGGYPQPPAIGAGWQNPGYGAAAMAPALNSEAQSAKNLAMIGSLLSVAALIIGWCCSIGFILGPVGATLGFVARSKLNRAGSRDGMGLAIFAIVAGIFAVVLPILFILVIFIIGALAPN